MYVCTDGWMDGWRDGVRCGMVNHGLIEEDGIHTDMCRNLVLGEGQPFCNSQSVDE
jgi:hypothetical protein